MRHDLLGRVVVVLAAAGLLAAACGEGVDAAGPPAGSPSITGTLTSVEPFVPRTEDCVQPGARPPEAPVSSDDELFCTDPSTDLVGSVRVETTPTARSTRPARRPVTRP